MSVASNLRALTERWRGAAPAERANAQLYIIELCNALEVEPPRPAGSGYEFDCTVQVVTRDDIETVNFIDLYKRGHFVLEAKDQDESRPNHQLLTRAFGQARNYAAHVEGTPPPYLLVLDVAKVLLVLGSVERNLRRLCRRSNCSPDTSRQ